MSSLSCLVNLIYVYLIVSSLDILSYEEICQKFPKVGYDIITCIPSNTYNWPDVGSILVNVGPTKSAKGQYRANYYRKKITENRVQSYPAMR